MAKKDAVETPVAVDSPAETDAYPLDSHFGGNGNGSSAGSASDPPLLSRPPGRDYGVALIVIGVVLAAVLTLVLVAMPGVRPVPEGATTPLPDNDFTRIINSVQDLLVPSSHSLPVVLGKLALAALFGGFIGYRQRIHVEE